MFCKKYIEFVPIILLTIILISEEQLEKDIPMTYWNGIMSLLLISIFYILLKPMKKSKTFAISIVVICWIISLYLKRCFFN